MSQSISTLAHSNLLAHPTALQVKSRFLKVGESARMFLFYSSTLSDCPKWSMLEHSKECFQHQFHLSCVGSPSKSSIFRCSARVDQWGQLGQSCKVCQQRDAKSVLEILCVYNSIVIWYVEEVSMEHLQYCMQSGTLEQAARIIKAIEGNIITLSLNAYGSRAVQRAIYLEERLGASESIFKELSSDIPRIMENVNHAL
jgi:hypothetical protein